MKQCDLAFDEAGERISLSKRSVTHGCTSALAEGDAAFTAGCGSSAWSEKAAGVGSFLAVGVGLLELVGANSANNLCNRCG
jgi:hypothetical protein